MSWFRKKKPLAAPDFTADYINGYRVRHRDESCPLCEAPKDQWCAPRCRALDLMDYR